MKLSFEWLSAYVDMDGITPHDLANVLTKAGLEVEGVEPRCGGELSGVVVGLVLDCEPHPNADKLKVCRVDIGGEEPSTIVCGAPNVAPLQKVPVAVPGSVLPGGSIGVAKLRGVESHGMLCSAKEIGLETKLLPKEQTAGLYLLPADLPVGADVASLLALDDWILDISLTPNRSDCLSMRGLVHEIGALLRRPVRFPDVRASAAALGESVAVKIRLDTEGCKRYEAQVLENVRVEASPLWLQMRLLAVGIRPISNIVDITNYVMLEWGQPLHAFDLDEVQGGTIIVRQGRTSESIVTLDGETRSLTPETLVIADEHRAIGIAGVMGGQNSEISGKTQRIVLESAMFNATSVRRTGQRLGLRSEAQQRFEKGIDPVAVHGALSRATELFESVCGAKVTGLPVIAHQAALDKADSASTVAFSPSRANRLLGTEISDQEMRSIFERLGFEVCGQWSDETWSVSIPTRRPDVTIEADLIEEVARVHGYEAIPSSLPTGATTVGMRSPGQRLRRETRDILTAAGMFEVFTYTFTHPGAVDALRVSGDASIRQAVALRHPMSEERTVMRTHLLPGLAQVASHNLAHGQVGGQIFEIGRVYVPKSVPLTEIPDEPLMLGGLWFGDAPRAMGARRRPYDFYDAKGTVDAWLRAIGCDETLEYHRSEVSWLHPGRSAQVWTRGICVGSLGELHPETARVLELPRAIYAEVHLDALLGVIGDNIKVERLPRFPSVERDLAVLVPTEVVSGELVRAAAEIAGMDAPSCLEACQVFDVYEGKGVPSGMKSVAISFVYRLPDRTMTDADVSDLEARVLEAWNRRFGAELRAGI